MTCRIIIGDAVEQLRSLPADSVDCCVTSPPYWGLRDYGVDGQLGMEPSLAEHIAAMVALFEEVRRVLKPTGTCWINYGDCYATTPNGRSAADVKATGNDDRTFRDEPFSTVGPILRAPSNVTGTCGTRDGSGRRGGGLTADECAADLRLSPLTVRPRFTELKGDGLIKDTGIRPANRSGRSASVMDATSLALNMERI